MSLPAADDEPEPVPPLVSVVVPSFNRAKYIGATIDSILAQEYSPVECIVVDGGSIDGTLDVLRGYGDRIRWLSRPDRGAFDAINDGWRLCSGEVFAWLNDDDVWLPNGAAVAVEWLTSHPDADVVYGDCGGIDAGGRTIWYGEARPWDLRRSFLHCDQIIHQAASFIRRSAIERVGGVYPAWFHDHDLWLRLSLTGSKLQYVPVQLASARIWHGNKHERPAILIESKVGVIRRIAAHPDLPPELASRRARAVSNAYLRCLEYLSLSSPDAWPSAVVVLYRAVAEDPSNLPGCAAYVLLKAGRAIVKLCGGVVKISRRLHGIAGRLARRRLDIRHTGTNY